MEVGQLRQYGDSERAPGVEATRRKERRATRLRIVSAPWVLAVGAGWWIGAVCGGASDGNLGQMKNAELLGLPVKSTL